MKKNKQLSIKKIELNILPEDLFLFTKDHNHPFFLDGRNIKKNGTSYLGCNPCKLLKFAEDKTKVWDNKNGWEENITDPLTLMRNTQQKRMVKNKDSIFWTGAVGYISYDFSRQYEILPNINSSNIPNADLYFGYYNIVLTYIHETKQWFICQHSNANKEEINFWNKIIDTAKKNSSINLINDEINNINASFIKTNISENEFAKIVKKTKEYILAGDIFQANLSQQLKLSITSDPYFFYSKLLSINPSPFAAYLEFGDLKIGCCSPERLFRVRGDKLETRPIAGTRKRGKTEEEDSDMYQELINNEKERAEHLMLVDLERNDMGKVSKYGSVHVNEFMIREAYSHVWHIVSNITSRLKPLADSFKALKAIFPGGTITGAPKIRAMEIIEELEPTRRGLYTGSIGYFSDNGDCDLNIVIRTFIVHKQNAYIQVGAGIVADSDPKQEYQETLNKAKALLKAAGVNLN